MDPQRNYASWTPVESSNVESIVWWQRRDGTGVLSVRYKARNGKPRTTYDYTYTGRGGTSEAVFHEMLNAPSKGKYRHANLTPEKGYRVDGPLSA